MQHFKYQIDEYTVSIYFRDNLGSILLAEARHRGQPLTGPYSFIKHPPHIPGGRYHLHLYCKQNQIFALNHDGTAHDRSHQFQIPNRVADALRQKFPDWAIPKNNMIESISLDLTAVLVEVYLHGPRRRRLATLR
jgi:hypothetical protein